MLILILSKYQLILTLGHHCNVIYSALHTVQCSSSTFKTEKDKMVTDLGTLFNLFIFLSLRDSVSTHNL